MVESINPTAKVDEQERKALSEGADIRDVYPDDYDEVISQSGLETSVDSQLKRTSKRRAFSFKYNCFYMQARNLSTDLTACSNIKRNLLTKYFSYRFSQVQPISKLDDAKLGRLFNEMVAYARKRVEEKQ